ncbi:transcriptional regulator with XRE-family HTH domain [Anaerosolibacter carboniphilus]|uniref:Transcriptional regulator with XRE-family HTH domain n=1 Tax=Anaerosolibacter carboniphilus TaxID=1417629 RepID=A0A841KYR4_9FIRM|nr:helix-turn-helix domain-containing protein [Anaerosolibacter carboniphilus]MBB6218926.1 transcriptional regulator with XRE-family HTH domain [Anaerosolibacter carboniphilus]
MSRVGEKLKAERLKKGMTPKQLGKKCGVTESFIVDIETGKKIVNEKLLSQISKALGVNLEEDMVLEAPTEEERAQGESQPKPVKSVEVVPQRRIEVVPLDQWEDALSNIIKKVPIYDIEMKEIKGYRNFPIIERKVEGFHPDKLIYIDIPDDTMGQYRMRRGDRALIYLNHEFMNGAFQLVEYEGRRRLRKLKKIEGNKVQLVDGEGQGVTKEMKALKIIGRVIRVEIDF